MTLVQVCDFGPPLPPKASGKYWKIRKNIKEVFFRICVVFSNFHASWKLVIHTLVILYLFQFITLLVQLGRETNSWRRLYIMLFTFQKHNQALVPGSLLPELQDFIYLAYCFHVMNLSIIRAKKFSLFMFLCFCFIFRSCNGSHRLAC